MSEPSRKTVSKMVDCSKWLRPKLQSLAPTTVLVRRTNSFTVLADHRCRWRPAAEARTQSSAWYYDGARPRV